MSSSNLQSPISNLAPRHVGVILDGNRRWAKQNGQKTLEGHRRGAEVFKNISIGLFERGVKYVSGYVFSTENWKRTEEEVDYLMRLLIKAVELHLDEYHQKNVKIRLIGSRKGLSKPVLAAIERTESKTADNTGGELILCFNYGGRQEIIDATKKFIGNGAAADDVDEQTFAEQLYAPDVPDIDLMIRTSGEQRISGFMLWRVSYAELLFIDKLWPDVTLDDMDQAIADYASRNRRFGAG